MYINETLANGLKERLWNELDDLDSNAGRIMSQYKKSHKIKQGSRRTFILKLDQLIRSGFGHSILAMAKCGSRESPLLRYAILGRSQEAINDWNEKMFCIGDVSLDTGGNIEFHRERVRIGEHAVSRVFQRHPEIYNSDAKEFEIFKIIPEFQTIAFLGQAMFALFCVLTADSKHSLNNMSIPFVSKSGIFLGTFNKEEGLIDVRTFVADHQLTPDQHALARQLRTHLEENYSAMLPFVWHQILKDVGNEINGFFSALYSVAPQFANLVTWNEHDLVLKREFQQLIIKFLNRHGTSKIIDPAL